MDTITKASLKRFIGQIGTTKQEFRDPQCAGLSVRVGSREAVWTLRGRLVGKQSTWRVGNIADDALADPKEARRRAAEAKALLGRGIDPGDYLKAEELRGGIVRTGDAARDGWLWPEAVDAFLSAKRLILSPKSITDYRKTLNAPYLRGIWDKRLLKSITAADIRGVTESIVKAGHTAQANHVLRVLKSLMSWATQQGGSGIADDFPVTMRVKPKQHRHEDGYVPTREELGNMFWRLNAQPLHPTIRLAAALLIFTVQRRDTIVSARKADFVPFDGMPGWGKWLMARDPQLLIDRHHAVPLPPVTWGLVQVAKMNAGSSEWLFPQTRARGGEKAGCLSGKAIYDALKDAGMGELSPHDLRRALATHGPDHLLIDDEDTKKILNHAKGKDVTGRHYAFHASMPRKVPVMEKWEGWLLSLTQENAPKATAWPDFFPQVPMQRKTEMLMLACEPPRVLAAS